MSEAKETMKVPVAKRAPMKTIGQTTCPACEREAPMKEQANGLAALSCGWCGYQCYARGEESDRHMRARLSGASKPDDRSPASKPEHAAPARKRFSLDDL